MARNFLSPVAASLAGTTVALAGPPNTDGDAIRPGTALWVNNANAGTLTVTVVTAGTAEGYDVADQTITIPTGQARLIGGFSRLFPQPSGADEGWIYINYSVQTSVTRVSISLDA